MRKQPITVFVSVMLSCLPLLAMGTTVSPDAGAMLSNAEQGFAAHGSKPMEGLPLEYYPHLRWTDEFSMRVESIVLNGNALVPTPVLQEAVKGFIGKRVSMDRLSSITNVVMKTYRQAGYRAHAYVPEQSFSRGKLVIQVIEKNTSP
jgi:hemolysin activation/secretion protein